MSTEIRINVVVRISEDGLAADATPAKTVLLAWEAFTAAIKGTEVYINDFYLGPMKPGRPARKRKPQLGIVKPPPTAA